MIMPLWRAGHVQATRNGGKQVGRQVAEKVGQIKAMINICFPLVIGQKRRLKSETADKNVREMSLESTTATIAPIF